MENKIYYKDSVGRDLRGIDRSEAKRIISKTEKMLTENSDAGKPLKGGESHSLRVGNYRVIYVKLQEGVLITRIGHRKDVYHNL